MNLLAEHRAALKRDVAGIVSASAEMIDESAGKLRDDLLNTAVKTVIAPVAEQAEKAGLLKLHIRSPFTSIPALTGVRVLTAALAVIHTFVAPHSHNHHGRRSCTEKGVQDVLNLVVHV